MSRTLCYQILRLYESIAQDLSLFVCGNTLGYHSTKDGFRPPSATGTLPAQRRLNPELTTPRRKFKPTVDGEALASGPGSRRPGARDGGMPMAEAVNTNKT